MDLCDAWRSLHTNSREFTFFSHVHHSYSRLDYFLVSSSLLNDISDTEIHPIAVSDHAAVSLTLVNKKTTPPSNKDLSKCLKCSIPASPLVCLLGDLDGVTTEDNTIHMAFTALCIAKKTVLMNWKNKNNLNINQYRDYLWDYISLETAFC